MDELHAIWNKLNDLQVEVGTLLEVNKVETIYQQLKKEEDLQKKWAPFVMPFIICMMLGMTLFIRYAGGQPYTNIQIIGWILITLGALAMTYLLQSDSLPLATYEHHKNSLDFLKIVKEKLLKRKHLWAFAVTFYIISLTTGLHLLIFGLGSLAGKGGILGAFYGIMFGLMGASAGGMYAMHQAKYGKLLKRIDRFLSS